MQLGSQVQTKMPTQHSEWWTHQFCYAGDMFISHAKKNSVAHIHQYAIGLGEEVNL